MKEKIISKGFVVGIIVLFVVTSIMPITGSLILKKQISTNNEILKITGNTRGNIYYVGGNGPNNYTKIQYAINDASNGDTVFVLDDSSPYYENVVIDKTINFFGENKDTTIIDGMKKSYVIDIQANDVHIRGFTIKNGKGDSHPSGIYSYGWGGGYDSIHIENNIITENYHGIYFVRIHNHNISNNIIKSNHNSGLHIYVSDNFTWQGNEITDNGEEGIFCVGNPNGEISYNMVTDNSLTGFHSGSDCNHLLISNNIFYNNGPYPSGFNLLMSSNCIIKNNYFNNILSPPYLEIEIGLESFDNLFYHNDVYHTPYDDEASSIWDDGYPSGGNYWDYYTGEDMDGDGIGDTPYTFENGEDRYPFMEPYNDNWIPYARFSYLEDSYNVIFDASSSFDFQGSIVSYEWDFGDGTSGEGKTISHDYNGPGRYFVTLEVTDDDGASDAYSWEVLLFPHSDLSCEDELVWDDVKPGETIVGSFIVKNNGSSGSFLDWEVIEYPEWGVWTFDPSSGNDLPGGDSVNVSVEVVAPDEPNKLYFGEVKLVNSEESEDYEIIDIILSTPRARTSTSFHWLLERFPLLERLLSFLLL